LKAPRFIEVQVTGLRTVVFGESRGSASFQQRYVSNTYRDEVTKVLSLVREGGKWRIARESVPENAITDRDVRHLKTIASKRQLVGQDSVPVDSPNVNSLQVTDWRAYLSDDIDGVRIVGTIRNLGNEIALQVAMVVRLLAERGTPIGRAPGELSTTALEPGNSMTFRADFPGVQDYGDVQFDIRSFDVVLRGGSGGAGEESAER
jgi:hypothetical protein